MATKPKDINDYTAVSFPSQYYESSQKNRGKRLHAYYGLYYITLFCRNKNILQLALNKGNITFGNIASLLFITSIQKIIYYCPFFYTIYHLYEESGNRRQKCFTHGHARRRPRKAISSRCWHPLCHALSAGCLAVTRNFTNSTALMAPWYNRT